jgi:hypothetical protein
VDLLFGDRYYENAPKTNAIEIWFNQIKHILKLNKKVLKFNELKLEVKKNQKS